MYHFATSKRGETLISILVGTVILAIAITAAVNILMHNETIDEEYITNNTVTLLQSNTENIIRKTDTSWLAENTVFYLYKNTSTKNFQILTGSGNEQYKYINRYGEHIAQVTSYDDTVYTRILSVEKEDTSLGKKRQIIKWGVKELIRK